MNVKKKIKCEKCGLYFRDREDPLDNATEKGLCMNCRFIWRTIGLILHTFPERLNRDVAIHFDDVQIRRKIKR